jgi:hypothetical protein
LTYRADGRWSDNCHGAEASLGLLLRIAFGIDAIYEAPERLLKTLRKSGNFEVDYEGSIPVTRSSAFAS